MRQLPQVRPATARGADGESNMPEWKEEIRRRLASLKLEPTRETAIIEELAAHLEDRYEELLANGVTTAEAERLTLAELSENETLTPETYVSFRQNPKPLMTLVIRTEGDPLRLAPSALAELRSFDKELVPERVVSQSRL
jgi:hypothetical protein